MDNYDKKPDLQVKQSSETSGTTIAIIVAALVLVVGAFIYFGNNSAPTDSPQVTQNNTTLPAPVIEEPAATPPAQPATPLVTPPADAPATNP